MNNSVNENFTRIIETAYIICYIISARYVKRFT